MTPEWLKSISAHIGVEGRNTIIVTALLFCAFGLWLFLRVYDSHPYIFLAFLIVFFLLAVSVILLGLLHKPQPSEVTQKFLLQQIGQQILYAGGLQSGAELIEVLRAAHNVQPLPPPSGIVIGRAANESDYKEISAAEAARLASADEAGVRRNLEEEVAQIRSALGRTLSLPEDTKRPKS